MLNITEKWNQCKIQFSTSSVFKLQKHKKHKNMEQTCTNHKLRALVSSQMDHILPDFDESYLKQMEFHLLYKKINLRKENAYTDVSKPTNSDLFIVNRIETQKQCEICSKLTVKTLEQHL